MRTGLRFLLLSLLTIAGSQKDVAQQPAAANPSLLESADRLYRSGSFAQAAEKYQIAVKEGWLIQPAQAGLIRSWLRMQKVDQAYAEATRDLEWQPNSAPLLAAMGDVQFRRGEMWDAETMYKKALMADFSQVQAHLGLEQLYRAYSLYLHAYDQLQIAHKLAPDDPEVQLRWLAQLPRKARLAALDAYLAGPHPDDPGETNDLRHYVEFLRATVDKPPHTCNLVGHAESTEIKLHGLLRGQKHKLHGSGMTVSVNGRNQRLLLDTGATGILITRRAAEKAGLKAVSTIEISGFGDESASRTADIAVADHIRVGELEFQDCLVTVSDSAVGDEDGLIGADVFRSYLVDIDFPHQNLKLSALPKRPDETVPAPKSLNSQSGAQISIEEDTDDEPATNSQTGRTEPQKTSPEGPPASRRRPPADRYVAPEMKGWTPVFRFDHFLLIPTRLDNFQPMLFLIDTGAEDNMLSQRAAKQVTKTFADPDLQIAGVSGTVKNVYRAETATLHFGHFAQENQYMVTVDLSKEARNMGTEFSGVLGFALLNVMQLKIDYRDGLVDFVYDAKH